MDAVERVRQLLDIMSQNDLAEIEVEEPDLRVKLRKNEPNRSLAAALPMGGPAQPGAYQPALQAAAEAQARAGAEAARAAKLLEITAPMVGTFYRAPNPQAEPYVSPGSQVSAETVVCIIEAMKVMNEIKAELAGTVVEVLVEDGEPVEFGQVLFLLEPPKE